MENTQSGEAHLFEFPSGRQGRPAEGFRRMIDLDEERRRRRVRIAELPESVKPEELSRVVGLKLNFILDGLQDVLCDSPWSPRSLVHVTRRDDPDEFVVVRGVAYRQSPFVMTQVEPCGISEMNIPPQPDVWEDQKSFRGVAKYLEAAQEDFWERGMPCYDTPVALRFGRMVEDLAHDRKQARNARTSARR